MSFNTEFNHHDKYHRCLQRRDKDEGREEATGTKGGDEERTTREDGPTLNGEGDMAEKEVGADRRMKSVSMWTMCYNGRAQSWVDSVFFSI